MRVLEINSVCGRQSTGRIVSGIKDTLEQAGHECVIAYGEKNSARTEGNYHIGSEPDRYFHAAMTRLADCHGLCSGGAARRLAGFIRGYDPDIIHLHNIHGYYLNYEVLFTFLKDFGKPVVWTLHDCWAFTGHCVHGGAVNCEKWKTGCGNCPQTRAYPKAYTDRSARNFALKKKLFTSVGSMTVVTPSEWLAGLVRESFLNIYPVRVINNGIDTKVFRPAENGLRESRGFSGKKLVLGVASVWSERKGFGDFIKLSQMLPEDHSTVLIGVNRKEKNILESRGITGIERTDSAHELAQWYSAADCFVNPTYEDTYPTVNLEALACGTPVVTYDTDGSPEALTASTGIVVEKGNISALREAVVSITSGENAVIDPRECVRQGSLRSDKRSYNEYLGLFETLCVSGR